jgi:aspartate aminotransferase
MGISKQLRVDMVHGSWIRKMFDEGLRLKAIHGAANVFDFTLGNPYVDPPPEFLTALKRAAAEERHGIHAYMQNCGFPEVRAKVAAELSAELGFGFTAGSVVMTVGAAGALNVLLKSLLDPGDEVVLVAPFFPEYAFYIRNHSGVAVVSTADDTFLPDLEDLDRKIGPHTRAMILNSPCNPSGRVVTPEVLSGLGDLLRRKSAENGRTIYLLSDEPYRRLLFDGRTYPSPFGHYAHTILATSHSKDLSLAGERIGYLAIGPECEDAADIFAAATFCNRTLGYVNAPALMQRVLLYMDSYQPNVAIYQRKRDRLFEVLTGMGYEIIKPEGTFFMFPKSPIPDDPKWVEVLARERVLVTPGTGFAFPGYFRISFAVDDTVIEGSFPGFERALKSVRQSA